MQQYSKIIIYTLVAYAISFAFWLFAIKLALENNTTIPLNEVLVDKFVRNVLTKQEINVAILSALALLGPLLSAILITLTNKDIRNNFIRRFSLRINPKYLLQIFGILLIISILPTVLGSFFIPGLELKADLNPTFISTFITWLLAYLFLGAAMEEIGWRGFLLPELLNKRHSVWNASMISGLIWGLWHTPIVLYIFYTQGMTTPPQIIGSFIGFLAGSVSMSVLHTYYLLKAKSAVISIIIHALFNAVPMILGLFYQNANLVAVIAQVGLWVIIFYLNFKNKGFFDTKIDFDNYVNS